MSGRARPAAAPPVNDDAREAAIRALLPLVKAIARRVKRMVPSFDLDDLIGDGCIGAIRAIDAFDPSRGVPVEHYARRVILGVMLNAVRRNDPVSERMRRTLRAAHRARSALAQQLGTMPSMQSLEPGTPALRRARTEVYRRMPLSLDNPLPNDERLVFDEHADPQRVHAVSAERARVRSAIATLPPRERGIVMGHYFGERSLREIAEPMRVSRQRVSQLHARAIEHLRDVLAPGEAA